MRSWTMFVAWVGDDPRTVAAVRVPDRRPCGMRRIHCAVCFRLMHLFVKILLVALGLAWAFLIVMLYAHG